MVATMKLKANNEKYIIRIFFNNYIKLMILFLLWKVARFDGLDIP